VTGRRHSFGIDYDGTIADTNRVKATWIRERLGREVDPQACDRTSCVPIIGADNYEDMATVVYEREWSLKAPPVVGALDGLRALHEHGQVYVLTARLPHRLAFAREWLEQHGVGEFAGALLSSADSDKLSVCKQHGIDVLVDDDERHLLPVVERGVQAILLKVDFNGDITLPAGVDLCRSWPEVLNKIGLRTEG
jgi:uncharacterized HAD superfamily protein